MNKRSIKAAITYGLVWTYAERITAQFITLLVSVILARLLSPNDYGAISIVMIFITLCNSLVTGGFGTSLVQKKNPDDLDFNSMLWFSLTIAVVLYFAIALLAPYIAGFYKMPILTNVIRVLGLRIPLSGINTIQHAKIQKDMEFKKFFFSTLLGTVISAFVGIHMAYRGYGIWALVAQYLTNTTVDTMVLFITSRWRIRLEFSWRRAKELIKFGWKVLLTSVVGVIQGDFRSLIIGKVFGSSDLAFYDQGKKYPSVIISNIDSSFRRVLLPAYSSKQEKLVDLKKMCRRSIQLSSYILTPVMIGLVATADILVTILLTNKWDPCVPFMRIFAIVYLLRPLSSSLQQAVLAIGRSDITLRIEVVLNVFSVFFLLIAVFLFKDVLLLAWGGLITEVLTLVYFLYYGNKILSYSYTEQFQDIAPAFLYSAVMGIIVYFARFLPFSSKFVLLLQISTGALSYLLISIFTKNKTFVYLTRSLNKSIFFLQER